MRESTGLSFLISLAFDESQALNGGPCAVFDKS